MKPAAYFTLGALAFGGAQAAWSIAHAHNLVRGTWILKTGAGIATCMAVLATVSAAAFVLRGKESTLSDGFVALEAGAVLAIAIALFIVGAGGLWPIVIVFDAAVAGAAIGIGAIASLFFRPAGRGAHPHA